MADDRGVGSDQTRGFLFADLRGYTDFVERRGDAAAARLLDRYRVLIRGVVGGQQGAEIRTEGDSFFVLFPSASRAVTAALEIIAAAAEATAEDPTAPIHVGIGVHAGETAELPEGPVGSAVNLAARICAQAKAGEVLVSDTVRGLTRTRQVATFVAAGSRRLKGIAEPMALYRALPLGATEPRPVITSRLGRPASSSWLSVAIGLLAIGVLALVGIALYNGMAGPGASATAGAPVLANTSPSGLNATDDPSDRPSPSAVANTPSIGPVTGTRILYSRQFGRDASSCDVFPLDAELWVLDPDSPEADPYRLTHITNVLEESPTWSADGSTIAFVAGTGNGPGQLAVVGPDGEDLVVVSQDRFAPGISFEGPTSLALSPTADAIVHAAELVWRTETDGSGMTELAGENPVDRPPSELFRDVAFRADGTLLVLVSEFEGDEVWLETMNADGSDRTRLDFDIGGINAMRLVLAPDDDTIAFEVAGTSGVEIHIGSFAAGPSSLTRLEVDLPNPGYVDFSPDVTALALHAGDRQQVYVVDLESGEATQLTDEPDWNACSPVWRNAPPNLAQERPPPPAGEPIPMELGVLSPGTYRNEITEPTMDLEIPEGWFARRNYVDGWGLALLDGPEGEVDYVRAQVGVEATCDLENIKTVFIGSEPADLLGYLESREDLEVTAPQPITLGGYSGVMLDVRGKEGTECFSDAPHWPLFHVAADATSLVEGETMRIIALDYGGRMLTFQIFTLEDIETYWDSYVRPLLQGLSFPDG